MSPTPTITPPRSWRDPETHHLKAIDAEWYRVIILLQDAITRSTVAFWTERGVRNGYLPVTTGSISSPMGLGSDSTAVEVDMFGVRTCLADSMQFGLEYLCRLNDGGAYYLMPSFRGEAADSTHLCQFFHSEAEIPGGLDDVIAVVEAYLRRLIADLAAEYGEQIAAVSGSDLAHIERVVARDLMFERMTFDEAVEVLDGRTEFVRTDPDAGWRTLTRAGERELMRRCGEFLWVTDWDQLAVPFYQATDRATGKARSGDLLFGPGEVVGCGERHTSGDQVLNALATHGVAAESYEWYVAVKDRAPMRTAGFGMGVERFLMWLLRADDIRDFQIFPRENGRDILP